MVKFSTNASGDIWLPTLVTESISGSVVPLAMFYTKTHKFRIVKKACSFRIVYSRLNLFTQCDKYQVWSKVSKIQASKSKREQKLCQSDLWHWRLQYWALLHEHESWVGALHTLHKPASPISSNQYRQLLITAFNFGLGGDWKGCVGVPVERIGEGRSAARWSQMMEHWNCQCGPM